MTTADSGQFGHPGNAGTRENAQPVARRRAHLMAVLGGHTSGVDWVAFSPDGTLLASAASYGDIRVWDRRGPDTGRVLPRRAGANSSPRPTRQDRITALAFAADSRTLGASFANGDVRLWNRDGVVAADLPPHADGATGLVFSLDGQSICTSSGAGELLLWDAQTLGLVSATRVTDDRSGWSPSPGDLFVGIRAISPDSSRAAVLVAPQRHLVDPQGNDVLPRIDIWLVRPGFDPHLEDTLTTHVGESRTATLADAEFLPDGRVLLVSDSVEEEADYLYLAPDALLCRVGVPAGDETRVVRWSPDRRLIAVGGGAGEVLIWDIERCQLLFSIDAHTLGWDHRKGASDWALGDVAWAPEGDVIATSGLSPSTLDRDTQTYIGPADFTVKLWRLELPASSNE